MNLETNLVLFPACDKRGWITDVLSGGAQKYCDHNAENIFFAWLLELPLGVDSKAAAVALLHFAAAGDATDALSVRLIELLQDLIADRPMARADTLEDLMQQVLPLEDELS